MVLVLIAMSLLCNHPRTRYPVALKLTLSDVGFVRKQLFWVLPTATISQALAHYVPSIFIPSYALDVGLTSTKGALLLSLLNLATAIR